MRWVGCLANIRANREAYKNFDQKTIKKKAFWQYEQCWREGCEEGKFTGPVGPEEGSGPGPQLYCTCFCLSW